MKALVVSILANGVYCGYLEYTGNIWALCHELIDAKFFPEDDVYSVEFYAKQYVNYLGDEYTYEIHEVAIKLR